MAGFRSSSTPSSTTNSTIANNTDRITPTQPGIEHTNQQATEEQMNEK
jgi:hypothetical protein